MLAQSVANQNNQRAPVPENANVGSAVVRVRDFVRMNPPEFVGSQVREDIQNFIDEVKKIFVVMHVTGNDRVELASYQLKDVAHSWYSQWKENKDPEATLSFITPYIAVKFDVSPETLSELFSVSTLVGDPVIARWVYINCPVTISQKVTSADLVEFEIVGFDVIVGMNWLHSCYASVDYRTRIVHFQFPDEPILEWKGSRLTPMGRFISYL
uniref:Gag-pol protein n=1 Tax=Solanum tuberosum TaxID=4113 RepID=M1DMG2_SOLTU